MSVVGFDIGNENCVIAVAGQGIDVLLNDESKRETPAVVSFGSKQRFLGSAGSASATMHPKSTISQIKRLIGQNFNEPTLQNDLKTLPFETSQSPDGGILIHLEYMNEKQSFTPVQILAMLLGHLKQVAEKNIEMQISECVIGIPSYFTASQRRAYLDAAEIAGLKTLRLMHDCTATALGYGIYKSDLPSRGPANVVFVDVGHCDTQVSVVAFHNGQTKVLSHAFDSNLGGRDFDEVLFTHFADQFKTQYNIDVYSSARASLRLRASCEKVKKILSANAESPLNIECLMDEKDVKGFIKRDDFEKLASGGLLERLSIPCRKALFNSGLSVDKIHAVELVGSGSRIPAITKMLASLFRLEPRRTLNASECVARGCAIQCAMLSPNFRVREYEVQDCFPFSIGFALDEVPVHTSASRALFPKGNAFPSIKMLAVHRDDIFQLEAFYANQDELPSGASTRISSFKIGPFRVSQVEDSKIKIKFLLNLHGIVTIESASLIVRNSATNNSSDNAENVEQSNSESSRKEHGHFGHEMRRLQAIRRQDIFVDEIAYGAMTHSEITEAREKEHELTQQDIEMERTKEKKNSLESYVYEMRNKLLNTYRSFATDSEKEGISSNLQQTEEWLYEDGDDESEHVYVKKLEDLKKMVDPIANRYNEEEGRALATKKLLNRIGEYRAAARSFPPRERDAVVEECNEAERWITEQNQLQDSLSKNADPILKTSEIVAKAEALHKIFEHVTGPKSPHFEPEEPEDTSEPDDMQVD